MTTMVVESYEVLAKAGVDQETAKQAAKVVLDAHILATKRDLVEMRSEFIIGNTGTLLADRNIRIDCKTDGLIVG